MRLWKNDETAWRVSLLLGLTGVAAATDAICYLGLGRVFPANMTGNTVLLGIGAAAGDAPAALRSATALAGFVVGALTAGTLRARPHFFVIAVLMELAPLAAWYGYWATLPATPYDGPRFLLIGLSGLAMGIQSGAVRRLGISGVNTTFITGTWTDLMLTGPGRLRGHQQHRSPSLLAAILLCYLGGAFVAGLIYHLWKQQAAIIPVALLALVSLGALIGTAPTPSEATSSGRA